MKYIFIALCLMVVGCQTVNWESLYGVSQSEVKKQMGDPVSIMRERDNEIWTYREGGCTKHVFFDAAGIVKYVDAKGVCTK